MEINTKDSKTIAKINGLSKSIKIIIAVILVLIVGVGIFLIVAPNKEGQVTTISESTLQKVLEISELSTVEYAYNAVATKYVEGKDEVAYYVAYEGTVKAGINFEQIDIAVDEDNKIVTITLPEVEMHRATVKDGSMDFIFLKDKYETESVALEAGELCTNDLTARVANEPLLKDAARENAIASVEALFRPWIESVDEAYEVVVK